MLSKIRLLAALCVILPTMPASAQQGQGDPDGGALFGAAVGGLIGGAVGAALSHRSPRGADLISGGGHPKAGGGGGGEHKGGHAGGGGAPRKKHGG